ncbi:Signal transduction histidine kinase [Pilibacter termitis]|uniref:Signal transduction histidine kinase n=1 Tax=Pilibacter termitis TaxID=263852 RepID=A0A1T4MPC2_9ENTE|nr:ATP-binding protein [Pilibacter termitis]SJZ68666.1 Signal transduction histidine kinase [Pilibacter termitis]
MKNQKNYFHLSIIFAFLAFFLFVYYYFAVSQTNYVGLSVRDELGEWKIVNLQKSGAAEKSGLKKGDILLSLDNQEPRKNKILNKWLIVEQVENVQVKRNEKILSISLRKNHVNFQRFLSLSAISAGITSFLLVFSRKQLISKRSIYFYYFLVSAIFAVLSLVPSSIGNDIGRFFIILMISIFPIFLSIFVRKNYKISVLFRKSKSIMLSVGIMVVNLLLFFWNLLFTLPMIFRNYLAIGIFYVLFFQLCLVLIGDRMKENVQLNRISQINIRVLSIFSVLPLFFCYVFQIGWQAPFPLVLSFVILPFFALLHGLILSRGTLFRYGLSEKVLYLAISVFLSIMLVLFILLSNYIPFYIVMIYAFSLMYLLLPLFIEIVLITKKQNVATTSLDTFLIAEEEREGISMYIHDTTIQELMFFIREVQEKGEVSKKETLDVIEEAVFSLRELCSDIYPLMIEELGLKSALIDLSHQLQRKYPVLIEVKFEQTDIILPAKYENFLLRSLKELINNSILHGKATEIQLVFKETSDFYTFTVKDNGHFIEQEKKHRNNHFGLNAIKEKIKLLGGNTTVDVGNGTKISLNVLKNKEKKDENKTSVN